MHCGYHHHHHPWSISGGFKCWWWKVVAGRMSETPEHHRQKTPGHSALQGPLLIRYTLSRLHPSTVNLLHLFHRFLITNPVQTQPWNAFLHWCYSSYIFFPPVQSTIHTAMPPRKKARASAASTPLTEAQPKTPQESGPISQPQEDSSPQNEDLLNNPWTDDQETQLFKSMIRWKPTGTVSDHP